MELAAAAGMTVLGIFSVLLGSDSGYLVPVHINIKVMMMLKISDRNMFLHYTNAALDVIRDEYKPELSALIEHVVAGDKEYVNNYINEQEAKKLKSLSWKK